MRKILLGLAIIGFLLPGVTHADLTSAKRAYDSGDFRTAFQEFKGLAEQGNGFAKNRLGELYRDGKGTDQNFEAAAAWFQKATDDGYLRAYWNLGRMYEAGVGLDQDYVLAFKWYYLGRTTSQNVHALRRVKTKMSPIQKAEAKNLARDLQRLRPSFRGLPAGFHL